jgi:dipeptidyl aminopeptidase/acylaminoacyl peptidase
VSCPADPSRLYGVDLTPDGVKRGNPVLLWAPNATWLREVELAAPEHFVARAIHGPPVDTFLLGPVGREAGRRYPGVLVIHGGPMLMYGWAFSLELQWLAANGYAVVYANPRGSQGYGLEFCRAVRTEWGKKDLADLYSALDGALARAPWLDPDRLGVAGGSYGGFMATWIVGHSDRFKAAVAMRPIVDWRSLVGTGDGGWRWLQRTGGKGFWEDDTWYRQQSPVSYVANIATPLLIEQQEEDLRCPPGQGEMLYTLLKYLGRTPVRLVRYPGESHSMFRDGRPWHRLHRLRQLVEWFDTYLKPEV